MPRLRWFRVLAVAAAFAAGCSTGDRLFAQQPTLAQEYWVYFGTYTRGASKGIYAYRFRPSGASLTPHGLVAETSSPSFLAVHPNGRFLYAANESEPDNIPGKPNSVSAFAIDAATGKLQLLNKVSSRGQGPCHVSIDKTGKTLLVANYGSGSVAAIAIGADGRLGESTAFDQHQGKSVDPNRQTGPHAHFILPSPDNRFVLTADLGLDQVLVYRFDPRTGSLVPNKPAFGRLRPGSGPRHLAFNPNGKYAYVNGEMSSTISTFAYEPSKGTLTEIQTLSTLPQGFTGNNSTAEVQVDKAGRFLYVSNRGHNSIAQFSIDAHSGKLTAVAHVASGGRTPRFFTLDPTGGYLLAGNQDSSTVGVFNVDPSSGKPSLRQTLTDVPEPVSIVFVPVSGSR